MRKPLTFTLLLILTLLLTLPTLAQTPRPEPTAAATPDAPTEAAPETEATAPAVDVITIDEDGTVTIPVDDAPEDSNVTVTILEFALLMAGALLTGAVGATGIAAYVMRDPARVAMIEKIGDSVPKETADRIVGVVEIFTPILVLVKEMFDHVPFQDKSVGAQITAAFDNERAKQRENANAQMINRGLNIEPQNVTPLPPMEPLNG